MLDLVDVAVLPAGRELDALVLFHACGWQATSSTYSPHTDTTTVLAIRPPDGMGSHEPKGRVELRVSYSIDLPGVSARDGIAIDRVALPISADGRYWWAFEQCPDGWMAHLREHHGDSRGGWLDVASEFGETLALAICRTALAAKVAA